MTRPLSDPCRQLLTDFGAMIVPFTARHFGASYPQGNKIEALSVLPAGKPFLFLDTDTLITGPLDRVRFDFARPSASMRREGTWPKPPLYGPAITASGNRFTTGSGCPSPHAGPVAA